MYLASSLKHLKLDDPQFNEKKFSMKRDALETISPSAFSRRENIAFNEENHDLVCAAEIIKGKFFTHFS